MRLNYGLVLHSMVNYAPRGFRRLQNETRHLKVHAVVHADISTLTLPQVDIDYAYKRIYSVLERKYPQFCANERSSVFTTSTTVVVQDKSLFALITPTSTS